jgi:hypothetical protein
MPKAPMALLIAGYLGNAIENLSPWVSYKVRQNNIGVEQKRMPREPPALSDDRQLAENLQRASGASQEPRAVIWAAPFQ